MILDALLVHNVPSLEGKIGRLKLDSVRDPSANTVLGGRLVPLSDKSHLLAVVLSFTNCSVSETSRRMSGALTSRPR